MVARNLEEVCRRIEADAILPKSSGTVAGLMSEASLDGTNLLGIGVVDDGQGDRHIELRVPHGTDPRSLLRQLATKYALPARAFRVVPSTRAALRYSLTQGEGIGHISCDCRGTLGAFLVYRRANRVHRFLGSS
jgi:hypothetical protein